MDIDYNDGNGLLRRQGPVVVYTVKTEPCTADRKRILEWRPGMQNEKALVAVHSIHRVVKDMFHDAKASFHDVEGRFHVEKLFRQYVS